MRSTLATRVKSRSAPPRVQRLDLAHLLKRQRISWRAGAPVPRPPEHPGGQRHRLGRRVRVRLRVTTTRVGLGEHDQPPPISGARAARVAAHPTERDQLVHQRLRDTLRAQLVLDRRGDREPLPGAQRQVQAALVRDRGGARRVSPGGGAPAAARGQRTADLLTRNVRQRRVTGPGHPLQARARARTDRRGAVHPELFTRPELFTVRGEQLPRRAGLPVGPRPAGQSGSAATAAARRLTIASARAPISRAVSFSLTRRSRSSRMIRRVLASR